MKIFDYIDKFIEQTPGRIVLETIAALVIAVGIVLIIFFCGVYQGRAWTDSKYLQERDKRMAEIAVQENESKKKEAEFQQLIAENAILKKQNEAAAETFRKFDARIGGNGKNLENLIKARNQKLEEINAESDYEKQIIGICQDYRNNGFGELSFCPRFEEKK